MENVVNFPIRRFVKEIYGEYILGLPADVLIPNIADIVLSPQVYRITRGQSRYRPIVDRQTFEVINLMKTFPSTVSDWKFRLDDKLVRMIQVKLSEPFTKDQLPLATIVFYCDPCRIILFYP